MSAALLAQAAGCANLRDLRDLAISVNDLRDLRDLAISLYALRDLRARRQ